MVLEYFLVVKTKQFMTKNILWFFMLSLLMFACTSTEHEVHGDLNSELEMLEAEVTTFETDFSGITTRSNHRNCNAMHVLSRKLSTNPGLGRSLAKIERHTISAINFKKGGNGNGNGNGNNGGDGDGGGDSEPLPYEGTITIPVVVHVVYANAQENISAAQIQSQIDVLNADFNLTNADFNPPANFEGVAADCDFEFILDQVIRIEGDRSTWGTNDAVKSYSPVVEPGKKLNMWVAQIGGGILGYAQFPGGSSATDGIVVSPQYFGSTGYVSAPFDNGRTTTHEVGHYFNLRHIWGDGRCKRDDFVNDTPRSDRPNYGCPSTVSHCRSVDMHMNYMDYVDDSCMFMFTIGQKERMRALFAVGGARESMVL